MTEPSATDISEIWSRYADLFVADGKLCKNTQALFNNLYIMNGIIKEVSGSTSTGSAVARWFKFKDDGIYIECDLMYDIARIKHQYLNYLTSVKNNPAFYYVKTFCNCNEVFDSRFNKVICRGCCMSSYYINGDTVKSILKDILLSEENDNKINNLIKNYFNVGESEISLNKDGVSVVFKVEAKTNDGIKLVFECDNIAAIKIPNYWPNIACIDDINPSGRTNKRKNLLTTAQIQDMKEKGFHIIPKSFSSNNEIWRISLSQAEAIVMRNFSADQLLAYLIVKVQFYYLKRHEIDENFTSFVIKNASYHCFAKEGKGDNSIVHWDEILCMAKIMLQFLISCFDENKKNMKHFFIKSVNVIEKVSIGNYSTIQERLRSFRRNIARHTLERPSKEVVRKVIDRVHKICKNISLIGNPSSNPDIIVQKINEKNFSQQNGKDAVNKIQLLEDACQEYDNGSLRRESKRFEFAFKNGLTLVMGEEMEFLSDEDLDHCGRVLRQINMTARHVLKEISKAENDLAGLDEWDIIGDLPQRLYQGLFDTVPSGSLHLDSKEKKIEFVKILFDRTSNNKHTFQNHHTHNKHHFMVNYTRISNCDKEPFFCCHYIVSR